MVALLFTGSVACAQDSGNSRSGPASPADTQPGSGSDPPAAGRDQNGAAAARRPPRLVPIARFQRPVEIKSAPGFPRLLFVVEQPGRIMVIRRGRKLKRPFLNLKNLVSYGGERGLLSIGFPPDYRKSKRFYVYFTDRRGDIRVVEYRRGTAVRARHHSARPVIRIPHRENTNHNGGQLHFLGNQLYFGIGDGGGGGDPTGNAQNRRSLLGKLIRINPRKRGRRPYMVPRSNPLVGRAGRNEIFAWGLRNPYRWSFDRVTARRPRITIADVGQDRFEEINYLSLTRARGANFGWNHYEGFSQFTTPRRNTVKPLLVLPHSDGNCSVVGGLVVRDRKLPALRGRYLFSDFCTGRVLAINPNSRRKAARKTGLNLGQISSFGESRSGTVFVTSLPGLVYRIRQ